MFFWRANCDTHHHIVVAKVRERLAISKKAALNFDVEIFDLKNLYELKVRK
jgi:hypothetical protein